MTPIEQENLQQKKKLNKLKVKGFSWTHQRPDIAGQKTPQNLERQVHAESQSSSAYLEQKSLEFQTGSHRFHVTAAIRLSVCDS